jgi:hypothetical protein
MHQIEIEVDVGVTIFVLANCRTVYVKKCSPVGAHYGPSPYVVLYDMSGTKYRL